MAKTAKAPQKRIYNYKGTDKQGHKITGTIEAINSNVAKASLIKQGIRVAKLKKKPKDLIPKKIKPNHITEITRQLSTMSKAGVPIIRALEVMIGGIKNHDPLRQLITQIKTSIESGNNLSDAIKEHPKYFDRLYCALIGAGEMSGTLDIMLDRVATHRESIESIKKKVKKALTYPIIVSLIAVGVTAILLAFAVPAFSGIFESSGKELPGITQFTVDASEALQAHWWKVIIAIFAFSIIFKALLAKYAVLGQKLDLLILKLPVIGQIVEKSALARFARTLETTSASGMHLTNALEAVATATGNWKYEKATMDMREEITQGTSILEAATHTRVFPPMMLQMISIGEESGKLEEMLANIARIYEEEVDVLVSTLSSMLEPIIMVVLGGVVGFLVVSMYVPMFQMGDAF